MFSVAAPFAGRLSGRFGFRAPVIVGALHEQRRALLPHRHRGPTPRMRTSSWRLCLVGIGFGLMLSPLSTAAALNSVHRDRAGTPPRASPTRHVRPAPSSASALLGALVQTRAVHAAAHGTLFPLPVAEARRLAATLGHEGCTSPPADAPLPARVTAAQLHVRSPPTPTRTGSTGASRWGGFVLLGAAVVAALVLRAPATAERRVEEDEPGSEDASERVPSAV